MTKPLALSVVYTSILEKKLDTTLKMLTENALANKHEKKNNCKMFAFTRLL